MKKFGITHPLYMSFYSAEVYRDVGRNWKGVAFLYLLFLLALCWLPMILKFKGAVDGFALRKMPALVEQLPPITITDGVVAADSPMPHVVTWPDTGVELAVIDTSGEVTSLEGRDAVMLLTADRLIVRKQAAETRIYDLSGVEKFYMDKDTVNRWIETARKWLPVVAYPIALAGSFVYRLLQALIFGLIGVLFARALRAELGYEALVRISVMALTPSIILHALLNVAGIRVPLWGMISFLVAVSYLYFGVKSNAVEPDAAMS